MKAPPTDTDAGAACSPFATTGEICQCSHPSAATRREQRGHSGQGPTNWSDPVAGWWKWQAGRTRDEPPATTGRACHCGAMRAGFLAWSPNASAIPNLLGPPPAATLHTVRGPGGVGGGGRGSRSSGPGGDGRGRGWCRGAWAAIDRRSHAGRHRARGGSAGPGRVGRLSG